MKYTEIARQSGDKWIERRLVEEEELANTIRQLKDKYPDDALYASTFKIHADVRPEEKEIPDFFEAGQKEGDLFFDFDGEEAADDCRRAINYLGDSLGVRRSDCRVYFSGGKGFHLIIPASVHGIGPRADLHSLFRRFAKTLAEGTCRGGTLDTKIYNARRMFRVPGTKHQGSARFKERLDIEEYCRGVQAPHTGRDKETQGSSVLKDTLLRIEESVDTKLYEAKKIPKEFLHRPLDCVTTVLAQGVPSGTRNDTTYTVALYYRSLGLSEQETKEKIGESVLGGQLEDEERERTIASAFRGRKSFGLRDSVLMPYMSKEDTVRWQLAALDEGYVGVSEVAREFLNDIRTRKGNIAKYHIPKLDARLGGLTPGELLLVGGSTGTGKSEFGFHIAHENARRGVPSAFITLEVSNRDFIARLVCGRSGIEPHRFWSGDLDHNEHKHVDRITADLFSSNDGGSSLPLFFRRKKSLLQIKELESLTESLIVEQHCRLIVIDHLHYMGGKTSTQQESTHVSHCIRAINNICVRYNIAVVVVAHFKKQPDPFHRPTLHEFRDSSAIEQEASTILILWRNFMAKGEEQNRTEFHIAKSRKDITLGKVEAVFNKTNRQYE